MVQDELELLARFSESVLLFFVKQRGHEKVNHLKLVVNDRKIQLCNFKEITSIVSPTTLNISFLSARVIQFVLSYFERRYVLVPRGEVSSQLCQNLACDQIKTLIVIYFVSRRIQAQLTEELSSGFRFQPKSCFGKHKSKQWRLFVFTHSFQ